MEEIGNVPASATGALQMIEPLGEFVQCATGRSPTGAVTDLWSRARTGGRQL